MKRVVYGLLFVAALLGRAADEATVRTIDLRSLVGPSQFQRSDAQWLVPLGRHVADGVPFQIDGIVELAGRVLQNGFNLRSNVTGLRVEETFDELHLLGAASYSYEAEGNAIAALGLNYADGSTAHVPIVYGRHLRHWLGPRHAEEAPLLDPRTRVAWTAEFTEGAKNDREARLFHAVLTNPFPSKIVRTLSLVSSNRPASLMLAALSVAPRNVSALPNTLFVLAGAAKTGERRGEPVAVEGFVKSTNGQSIANALVKITGVRELKANYDDLAFDHPALGRETRSGADGKFIFTGLPDDKSYHLLAFAEGFDPEIFLGAAPRRSGVQIRLKPSRPLRPSFKHSVYGKLIGPDGNPVSGAMVEPNGVGDESGTSWGGGREGLPNHVVTGPSGEFLMERQKPFTRLQLEITAPGFALAHVWLPASNGVQTITLGPGALVTGRVIKDGQPLPRVRVGISGADRSAEVYAGRSQVATDEAGRFTFRVAPNTKWFVYGIIDSLKAHGAIGSRPVLSGRHGQTNDAGDLNVVPGLRLAGVLKTKDGNPLPKDAGITLGYDAAWDHVTVNADAEGRFELSGLPAGMVEISVRGINWQASPVNRSLDLSNPWRLVGLLQQDKTNLVIAIEDRKRNLNSYWNGNGQLPQQDHPRSLPLSGVEPSGVPDILLAGTVVDDATGQLLRNVKITPGRQPPIGPPTAVPQRNIVQRLLKPEPPPGIPWNERPYWDVVRAESSTNGSFALSFMPLSSTPILRVEAEGYQPFDSSPYPSSETNMVVRLKKGLGPTGVVLLPNGKPAAGATVFFGGTGEQLSLSKEGVLSLHQLTEPFRTTGSDGRYSFQARTTGERLFASHTQGFADVRLAELPRDGEIKLEPWAVLRGVLVDKNGAPAPDMKLTLVMRRSIQHREPFVNFGENPITDAQGRFEFLRAPAGELNLVRLVPMSPGSWSHQLQTPVIILPGKTNDLGKVILDTPPPPSFFEEMKKKVGL